AWGLFGPAAMLLGNSVLHALRVGLLAPSPAPPLRELVRIALLGNFFGLVLPSGGGEAVKVVLLAPRVGGVEPALGMLGTVRLFELLPWALFLVWGALVVLPGTLPEMVPLAWLAASGMGAALVVGGLGLRYGDAFAQRLPAAIGVRVHRIAAVTATRGRLALCGVLAFPFALTNVVVVWVILRAYGVALPMADVLGVVPAADVIITLPVTISGLGVREGLYVHVLAAWRVAEPVALAVAFTRWVAELGRGSVGGLLFALSRRRPDDVTNSSQTRG
ncbi:MAG: lysylphosphatidylglycerol synthase transmembrane domain-containing protein, partial [Myxococcota bacterium]